MTDLERPCTHPRARHEHGDRKRYSEDGCRCAPCTTANTAYARLCYRNQVLGITARRWVSTGPVIEHVQRLRAAGMGTRRIAEAAGVERFQVHVLTNGRADRGHQTQKRIRRETAQALLAVELDIADGARVTSRGARRRIQALNTLGWSTHKLAALIGMNSTNLHRAISGEQVVASTHRAIAALYDELWDQRPTPVTHHQLVARNRTVNTATRRGYVPPLAWDDIDLDDQPPRLDCHDDVVVDHVVIDRLCAGQRPARVARAELVAAVLRMHAAGMSDGEVGDRIGMKRDAVASIRYRTDASEVARLIDLSVRLNVATLTERRTA